MATFVECPSCNRRLRVPEELLGKQVKCPACSETFTAEGGAAPPVEEEGTTPSRGRPRIPPAEEQFARDDESRPKRGRPSRPAEPEQEPSDEGYDDEGEALRRRRRHFRRDGQPHRGGLILTLGILSLVICGLLGPFAWAMGNSDLAAMRAGRMDPSGEGLTLAGKICGMIATIILIVVCVGYALFFLAFGLVGMR